MYNGVFQFNSCINDTYCFIKFDSRSHVIRWKKQYVKKVELDGVRPRRCVRRTQHFINEMSANRTVEASSTAHVSVSIDNSINGNDYEEQLERFGYGNENKPSLDESWLDGQGFVHNSKDNVPCVICCEPIKFDDTVYNIKCYGKLQHIFHKVCIYKYVVENRNVSCPICRNEWLP